MYKRQVAELLVVNNCVLICKVESTLRQFASSDTPAVNRSLSGPTSSPCVRDVCDAIIVQALRHTEVTTLQRFNVLRFMRVRDSAIEFVCLSFCVGLHFYRAMHYVHSAVLRLHGIRLSVCNVGGL